MAYKIKQKPVKEKSMEDDLFKVPKTELEKDRTAFEEEMQRKEIAREGFIKRWNNNPKSTSPIFVELKFLGNFKDDDGFLKAPIKMLCKNEKGSWWIRKGNIYKDGSMEWNEYATKSFTQTWRMKKYWEMNK